MTEVTEELYSGSDRACVLLCAALLDRELEALLRATFKMLSGAGKEQIDKLLSKQPMPPLGSFSMRAHCARLMGLIEPSTASAIAAIASLRNHFAHETNPEPLELKIHELLKVLSPEEVKQQLKGWYLHPARAECVSDSRRLLIMATFALHLTVAKAKGGVATAKKLREKPSE